MMYIDSTNDIIVLDSTKEKGSHLHCAKCSETDSHYPLPPIISHRENQYDIIAMVDVMRVPYA